LRSRTAPEQSATDFDDDGITDAVDRCPATPRGVDADGDGCPDRAPKLADANGNGIPDSAETSSDTTSGTDRSGTADTTTPPPSGSATNQPSIQVTPRMNAKLAVRWKATKRNTKVVKLIATGLRKGDRIQLTCAGKGCAFKRQTVKAKSSKVDMLRLFKKRALNPNAVITIRVTRPGAIGQVVKFTMRKAKSPRRTNLCVPLGSGNARARC
jgi:hypothetical protein